MSTIPQLHIDYCVLQKQEGLSFVYTRSGIHTQSVPLVDLSLAYKCVISYVKWLIEFHPQLQTHTVTVVEVIALPGRLIERKACCIRGELLWPMI